MTCRAIHSYAPTTSSELRQYAQPSDVRHTVIAPLPLTHQLRIPKPLGCVSHTPIATLCQNHSPHSMIALQVYTVSGGKTLPQWLSDKKRRSLRKDEAYRRRIELVQDLDFPEACHRLKLSPDGQFLIASGLHPPRVRPRDP